MAVYAIGDLQGCYDPFRRLLDKLDFDPGRDTLWLAGDLVNRGPKSLKTLRFVRSLGDAVVTVLGNHDLHLLVIAHERTAAKRSASLAMKPILRAHDCDELIDWLQNRPLVHYDEGLDTVLVHAGVLPAWDLDTVLALAAEVETVLRGPRPSKLLAHLYGNEPDRWRDDLHGVPRWRFIVNVLTRMRMLTRKGRLDFDFTGPPEDAPPKLTPWYRARDRALAGTRIVFGHWSALGLLNEPDLVCLDTGCVWGRALTALRLDRAAKPVKVKCRDQSR
jgi:bis(5'-nucleosyl)-tetraphosphatase (symmetrical)